MKSFQDFRRRKQQHCLFIAKYRCKVRNVLGENLFKNNKQLPSQKPNRSNSHPTLARSLTNWSQITKVPLYVNKFVFSESINQQYFIHRLTNLQSSFAFEIHWNCVYLVKPPDESFPLNSFFWFSNFHERGNLIMLQSSCSSIESLKDEASKMFMKFFLGKQPNVSKHLNIIGINYQGWRNGSSIREQTKIIMLWKYVMELYRKRKTET